MGQTYLGRTHAECDIGGTVHEGYTMDAQLCGQEYAVHSIGAIFRDGLQSMRIQSWLLPCLCPRFSMDDLASKKRVLATWSPNALRDNTYQAQGSTQQAPAAALDGYQLPNSQPHDVQRGLLVHLYSWRMVESQRVVCVGYEHLMLCSTRYSISHFQFIVANKTPVIGRTPFFRRGVVRQLRRKGR